MRLYLDDIRQTPTVCWLDRYADTPRGYTHSPKTAWEAIELLKTGNVEFISFDHDLGPITAGTGYDVAKWIEEQAYTNADFTVPDWYIHSGNPVGAANIQRTMLAAVRAAHKR